MWEQWTRCAGLVVAAVCLAAPVAAARVPGPAPGAAELDTQLADSVAKAGLRPVEPATPAVEIALPDLSGKRVHLSDFSGRWVLVTFLASWCGPCASEMPALAALARDQTDALTVLGVAIESDRDAVAAFAAEHGAQFPVLIDAQGKAAAAYDASSIPLSYLIRPDGRIAGVARGARDWAGAQELVNALNRLMPASSEPSRRYALADKVELPVKLTPPTAEVKLASARAEAGAPFAIDVRVTWAGTLEDYVLLPPVAELPAGVVQGRVSARSSSTSGAAVVDYSLELWAEEPGRFAIDPIELRYTPRHESGVLSARVRGPIVEVQAARLMGLTAQGFAIAGGGALSLALLALAVRRTLRRRQQGATAAQGDAAKQHALAGRLADAHAARVRGDVAGLLEALVRLHQDLGEIPPAELGEAVQAARYGGIAPPPNVLDAWERRAERLVAQSELDEDAEALR